MAHAVRTAAEFIWAQASNYAEEFLRISAQYRGAKYHDGVDAQRTNDVNTLNSPSVVNIVFPRRGGSRRGLFFIPCFCWL